MKSTDIIKLFIHKIKRTYIKKYIWYKINMVNPDMRKKKLTPNERCVLSISLLILNNKDSILSLCPITGKRYIKYNDYFIVIDGGRIQIVNHVYGYDIFVSGKQFYNLKRNFDNKLYYHFKGIETEILSNVKHSLDTILLNIKKPNE
jgi:hypothetical protein